jgi:hypothetical protein
MSFTAAPARRQPTGRTPPRFSPAATWRPGAPGWGSAGADASRRSRTSATRARRARRRAPAASSRAAFWRGMRVPGSTLRACMPCAASIRASTCSSLTARPCGTCTARRGAASPHPLAPGIYALSNAALDVPWPKVERARRAMSATLEGGAGPAPDAAALRACVADRQLAAASQLHGSDMSGEMARRLSAQFIVTPEYGTRCTTTLRWHRAGARRVHGAALRGRRCLLRRGRARVHDRRRLRRHRR